MFSSLKTLFSRPRKEIRELIPELEETLLLADVGISTTAFLLSELAKAKLKTSDDAFSFLQNKMVEILTPLKAFEVPPTRPAVFMFVGVNGTGKTTTIGKLANRWHKEGLKVLMVAADTFRAAAPDQLKIWAARCGAEIVAGQMNADPASVVFDGIRAAQSRGVDLVLLDTAGRLHTKEPLMEELKKMNRVIVREKGTPTDEIFLVLDATTGQNGLSQAKVFQQALPLTGLILTKYDSTSKGGILLSVVKETGLPLRFVGVGEKSEDLKLFDPKTFVEGMF